MPKVGMEPIRRHALITAVVDTIHDCGARHVTMGEIAKRAGVSPGLAHHYFGGKDELLYATMRYLLTELGNDIRTRLIKAETPRQRVQAIIQGNLSDAQRKPAVISAWIAFYDLAKNDVHACRLLTLYARRLRSNLIYSLSNLTDKDHAAFIAEGIAALIDGLWIRLALGYGPNTVKEAIQLVENYVDAMLISKLSD